MSFLYEEKASRSAFVDVIWHTLDTSDGIYLASADACWDLIVTRATDGCSVRLSGPSSKPTSVAYTAGNRNVGIRFRTGVYFTHGDPCAMFDRTITLPMLSESTFALAGREWDLPTYGDIDDFVDELAAVGLLADDAIVSAALDGAVDEVSPRSVQRHFSRVIGLTPRQAHQVARAREAVARLQTGEPIAAVSYELGYADQAHMSRDVKRLTGYTPGQSRHRGEPI
ncbi:MAG: helix-turn-helix domain-containing protein [Leifsonia sp.]